VQEVQEVECAFSNAESHSTDVSLNGGLSRRLRVVFLHLVSLFGVGVFERDISNSWPLRKKIKNGRTTVALGTLTRN
jgi:hypothetical protein